ncbi:MAG: hypothetical protein HN356_15055 [Calditrichaeota bacterium]|nr:hypothetical protein [Calditrichota bacterium]
MKTDIKIKVIDVDNYRLLKLIDIAERESEFERLSGIYAEVLMDIDGHICVSNDPTDEWGE